MSSSQSSSNLRHGKRRSRRKLNFDLDQGQGQGTSNSRIPGRDKQRTAPCSSSTSTHTHNPNLTHNNDGNSTICNNQGSSNNFTTTTFYRNFPNSTSQDNETDTSYGGVENVIGNHQAQGDPTPPRSSFDSMGMGMEKGKELDDTVVDPDPEYMAFLDHCSLFLKKWIAHYENREGKIDPDESFLDFLKDLVKYGILRSDDLLVKFMRTVVQLTVNPFFNGMMNPEVEKRSQLVYLTVDASARLFCLLIRHIVEAGGFELGTQLLYQFMGIVTGALVREHNTEQTNFNQMPFHRLLIMFFLDMSVEHPDLQGLPKVMVTYLGYTLFHVRPAQLPGFAFAWIEIVGHRAVLSGFLIETPTVYYALLMELIRFMEPFFRAEVLPPSILTLYQGLLRILTVILQVFPDFLSDFVYQLLDVIPSNCVQLRNLILSAFPKHMIVSNPFSRTLQIHTLPEIHTPPKLLYNVGRMVTPIKQALDEYLTRRYPDAFLIQLRMSLLAPKHDASNRYNVPLLNAVVIYCGSMQMVLLRCRLEILNMFKIVNTPHMDIFESLAASLDTEGRYLFLTALANQLRFPSSHTYYFYLVILHLFLDSRNVIVKEQITRVLLERMVVCRPHPWGLIVTTAELMRNPIFNFWSYEFVKNFPFVANVFKGLENTVLLSPPLRPIAPLSFPFPRSTNESETNVQCGTRPVYRSTPIESHDVEKSYNEMELPFDIGSVDDEVFFPNSTNP